MGIALAAAARPQIALAACGLLFCLVPPMLDALPQALLNGISHASFHFSLAGTLACLALAAGCAVCRRERGVAALALFATATVVWVAWRVYPVLDRELSGRPLWLAQGQITCLPPTNRSRRDSIRYYVDRNLPDCK
jgi:hypothetical protein